MGDRDGVLNMFEKVYCRLLLPWQKPQNIEIRMLPNGTYRTSIVDRYDRVEWLAGEDVGFDVLVFQSMRFPRTTRLTIKKTWDEAIFRNFEGQALEVEIFRI
jgi:hypothetical protein